MPPKTALLALDETGTILEIDGEGEALFGYRPGEASGLRIERLLPSWSMPGHAAGPSAAGGDDATVPVASAPPWSAAIEGLRKNGTTFPATASALSFRVGTRPLVLVSLREADPLEEEGAAAGTSASPARPRDESLEWRARVSGILEAAVDGIVIVDDKGKIQEFNPAAEKIFRYSAEEIIGRNIRILMPEPDGAGHPRYLQKFRDTRIPRVIGSGREIRGRRRDGSIFPMELSVGEIALENELLFVGIARDITERKAIETRLAKSEEQLRLTFTNAPIAIIVCDIAGIILRVNPEACSMLGYPEEELVGLDYRQVTHPEFRKPSRRFFNRLISGEVSRLVIESRYIRKDGGEVQGLLHSSVIPGTRERPTEVVIQIVDQTDQVRAEQEARAHRERLAHLDRLGSMGEMAAGIAHEINQPLTAIATFAKACRRLLDDGRAEQEDLIDALDQIHAQAIRAGEVIRRLKSFVRKRESHHEITDVNQLIRDIVKLAEFDARIHHYAIHLVLEKNLPRAVIDPIQIQQVILNLIRNGVEAMRGIEDAQGAVTVRTLRSEEEEIEIAVADRGAGVSEGLDRDLYNPFFTTKESGMGLGLSISRSIIVSHGGRLWFTRNPDRGATFHFTLPTALEGEHEED